ncbi:MAG: hypothetical protein ACXWZY_10950 [Gaiellaceae bacterium]
MSGSAYFGVAQRLFLTIMLSWALTVSLRGIETFAHEPGAMPAGIQR